MNRKVRSDAKLLNLPPERQEQIADWCETPKSATCVGGFAFAREQLAADSFAVSERALSDFYSTWKLRRIMATADHAAKDAEQWFKDFDPADAERARQFGEFVFMSRAVREQDPKVFAAMTNSRDSRRMLEMKERFDSAKLAQKERQLAQKDKDLQLVERRVALLEAKAEEARQTVEDTSLSAEEQAARIREIFKK